MRPRSILLTSLLAAAFTFAARGKEFRLPPDKPTVSIDIPEEWKPEFITRGVQAQTSDNDVFLSVEATADPKEMTTIIDESDATLKGRKVKLDRASRRDTKFTVNHFPAEELRYIGIDDHGSVTVSFTFVTIRDFAVVFTYLANEEGHKQYQPDLGKIFDSLKALGPAPSPSPLPVVPSR